MLGNIKSYIPILRSTIWGFIFSLWVNLVIISSLYFLWPHIKIIYTDKQHIAQSNILDLLSYIPLYIICVSLIIFSLFGAIGHLLNLDNINAKKSFLWSLRASFYDLINWSLFILFFLYIFKILLLPPWSIILLMGMIFISPFVLLISCLRNEVARTSKGNGKWIPKWPGIHGIIMIVFIEIIYISISFTIDYLSDEISWFFTLFNILIIFLFIPIIYYIQSIIIYKRVSFSNVKKIIFPFFNYKRFGGWIFLNFYWLLLISFISFPLIIFYLITLYFIPQLHENVAQGLFVPSWLFEVNDLVERVFEYGWMFIAIPLLVSMFLSFARYLYLTDKSNNI